MRNYHKPEKENQTNSEKPIASDVAHKTGTNNTVAWQNQRNVETSATKQNCTDQNKEQTGK